MAAEPNTTAACRLCRRTRRSASIRTATTTAPGGLARPGSATAAKCRPSGPSAKVTSSRRAAASSARSTTRAGGAASVLARTEAAPGAPAATVSE